MKMTPEKLEAFCVALALTGQVRKACDAVGISRQTAYEWRRENTEFADAWQRALADSADVLEDEAFRRAHDGIDKPVHYMGSRVDTVKEYSDTLLIFLLKGMKPEKYRERVEHSGSVDIAARILEARKRAGVGEAS